MNPAHQLDFTAMMVPFYQRMPFMFLFMVAILLVKFSLRIIADRCGYAVGGRPRRGIDPGRTMIALVLLPVSLGMLHIGFEGAIPGSTQSFVDGMTRAWVDDAGQNPELSGRG